MDNTTPHLTSPSPKTPSRTFGPQGMVKELTKLIGGCIAQSAFEKTFSLKGQGKILVRHCPDHPTHKIKLDGPVRAVWANYQTISQQLHKFLTATLGEGNEAIPEEPVQFKELACMPPVPKKTTKKPVQSVVETMPDGSFCPLPRESSPVEEGE